MNDSDSSAKVELNPYYGTVIGFVNRDGELISDPQENQHKLLINVGEMDEVKVGERVLVFELGSEIIDPTNGEALGHFEIVKGEGKIASVQTKMAIVTSSRVSNQTVAKPQSPIAAATGVAREYETKRVSLPFRNPKIGDLVRFV